MMFDVPLRTRRGLLLYKVYGDSALLVLNGTALMPLWLSVDDMLNPSSLEPSISITVFSASYPPPPPHW